MPISPSPLRNLAAAAFLAGALAHAAPEADRDDPPDVENLRIKLADGDHILFFGDSLTELGQAEGGYVPRFREAVASRHADVDVEVSSVATGGHKVTDLLERVDRDVISKKPTIVVIQIGVNDAAAGVTPEDFKSQLEELISRLNAADIRVILCSLTSLGEKHDGTNPIDDKLDDLADVARTVAREQEIPLNDLRKAFVQYWKDHNPDNASSGILTYDGNHFNETGHRFVARRMLSKFE